MTTIISRLKFRGWRVDINGWWMAGPDLMELERFFYRVRTGNIYHATVGQSLGDFDANGEEIYSGMEIEWWTHGSRQRHRGTIILKSIACGAKVVVTESKHYRVGSHISWYSVNSTRQIVNEVSHEGN